MTDKNLLLVIDEGTTSTRAISFDREFNQISVAQKDLSLTYPRDGWVEQDGTEIWELTLKVCKQIVSESGGVEHFAAIGITNQRETTLVWDRATGEPIAPAIVWQDRRTAELCERLKTEGLEDDVQSRTGLLLNPYFSATKIAWILDNTPGARERAGAGDLAFGTVDSFLIWHLTGGQVHAIDVTNASRTLLYKLGLDGDGGWDKKLCELFDVPMNMLPDVRPSAGAFGESDAELFGESLPILSSVGDQQGALVGQGCLEPGMAKITFGTGAFLVANTGAVKPVSENRLLGTVAYKTKDASAMALEGSIFNAGTVIKWLRDDMGLVTSAQETETLARSVTGNAGVYLVPAFTGLGAPHWDSDARGLISGLTRASSRAHIVRAGLEAAAYQTYDLLKAFAADNVKIEELRVDGGMVANDWLMQFLADVCDVPVMRPDYLERTALGAAALAAMALGWISPQEWAERKVDGTRFSPNMAADTRNRLLKGWETALQRTKTQD